MFATASHATDAGQSNSGYSWIDWRTWRSAELAETISSTFCSGKRLLQGEKRRIIQLW